MQYWCFPNIGILVNRSLGAKIQWSFHWGMFWQCFGDLENELMFGCFFFHRRKRKYSIAVLQYYRSLCYVWSSCVVIKLLHTLSPQKKRFIWSNWPKCGRVNPICFYGIFDHFLLKIFGKFTFGVPNPKSKIYGVSGWVHKFGPFVTNKRIFLAAKQTPWGWSLNVIMRLPFSRWPRSPCWSRLKSGNLATLVQSQFSSLDRRPRRRRKKSGCFSQLTAWQMFESLVNTKNYWNQPTKPCITYQYFF